MERAGCGLYAAYLASGITMRTHGTLGVSADSIFERKSGPGFIRANGGARFTLNTGHTLGVFGLSAAGNRALYVTWNGVAVLRGYLYGYGNTFDYAIEAGSGSNILYASGFVPVVTAAAIRDTLVGNLPRAYGVLPVSNLSRMCGIVLI